VGVELGIAYAGSGAVLFRDPVQETLTSLVVVGAVGSVGKSRRDLSKRLW
jgi:hypothetical protein